MQNQQRNDGLLNGNSKGNTRDLPSDEDGNKFYVDGVNLNPLILSIWIFFLVLGTFWLIIMFVCIFIPDWTGFGVMCGFGVICMVISLFFFSWWFCLFTKKRLRFNGEGEMEITTIYVMFPCYNSRVCVDLTQINRFYVRPTFITGCYPNTGCCGNLKQFRAYLQTLGQQQFRITSPNKLKHHLKLIKLLLKQGGFTNLGEVERVMGENVRRKGESIAMEKKREEILEENARKRKKRLEMLKKREEEQMADMDPEEREQAKKNWRRMKDQKRIRQKYGSILH